MTRRRMTIITTCRYITHLNQANPKLFCDEVMSFLKADPSTDGVGYAGDSSSNEFTRKQYDIICWE